MHFARKAFATSVIAAACAVPGALLLSATASADPVPAVPAMPNIPFLNGISPATAPQMLQGLASAFTGSAATPVAAPAAAPAATASVTLPQAAAPAAAPVATLPGSLLPAAAAPAAVPAAQPAGLVPTAEVQLPQVANNPLPLPKELSFPGDLTSLLPPGLPLANLLPRSPAAVPVAAAVPVTAAAPAVAAAAPAATIAALPAAADGALLPLFFPTSALP